MERERAAWQMALYLSSIDLNDDSRGQDLHAETQTEVSTRDWPILHPWYHALQPAISG